jgi:hypothetical protein
MSRGKRFWVFTLSVTLLSSATVSDTSSVTLHTGRHPIQWQVPAGELTVSPLILLLSFPVFLLIGRRAARPIERARRQQLPFAVDASHELRTPLTVVEGEASLALRGLRRPAEYRLALEKILAESRRMRQQVDDLIWLARSEADPVRPEFVAVDLARVADLVVERFASVAAARGLDVTASTAGAGPRPVIVAPLEWMERLAAVLLDNACRYTPEGGRDPGDFSRGRGPQHAHRRGQRAGDTGGGAGSHLRQVPSRDPHRGRFRAGSCHRRACGRRDRRHLEGGPLRPRRSAPGGSLASPGRPGAEASSHPLENGHDRRLILSPWTANGSDERFRVRGGGGRREP